jgi:hypothetical protein
MPPPSLPCRYVARYAAVIEMVAKAERSWLQPVADVAQRIATAIDEARRRAHVAQEEEGSCAGDCSTSGDDSSCGGSSASPAADRVRSEAFNSSSSSSSGASASANTSTDQACDLADGSTATLHAMQSAMEREGEAAVLEDAPADDDAAGESAATANGGQDGQQQQHPRQRQESPPVASLPALPLSSLERSVPQALLTLRALELRLAMGRRFVLAAAVRDAVETVADSWWGVESRETSTDSHGRGHVDGGSGGGTGSGGRGSGSGGGIDDGGGSTHGSSGLASGDDVSTATCDASAPGGAWATDPADAVCAALQATVLLVPQ